MDNEAVIQEVSVVRDYKVYKEKPYSNSEGELFGLTINGKTKEYLNAHDSIKCLMKRGKQLVVLEGKMKILDVTQNKAMIDVVVEVSKDGCETGNAQLKVYNPSKKRGATLEMRKITGYEYAHVEILKNIIIVLLDGFIDGNDVERVILNNRRRFSQKHLNKVISKPKLFTCDVCNWETNFPSALKTHKTRMHNYNKTNINTSPTYSCNVCEFQSESSKTLNEHIETLHKNGTKRQKDVFKCDECKSTFESGEKLKDHIDNQHLTFDYKSAVTNGKLVSPSSSPPRKKNEPSDNTDDTEVEMLDIEMEAEGLINKMLENRIHILEKELVELKAKNFSVTNVTNIPKHLSKVKEKHLKHLKGFRMKFDSPPNGSCLETCAAVHIYENEKEGRNLKRRVNHHMAENWDGYYDEKITLPFIETVGVGKDSKTVIKNTKKEMIDFLKSDDSLFVFSNTQELLAIANLFNINIHIFSYSGEKTWWSKVQPDPEMAATAELKYGKCVPDMFLYNEHNSHYDLLVKDDSRIALIGQLAGLNADDNDDKVAGVVNNDSNSWEQVKSFWDNNVNEWEEVKRKNVSWDITEDLLVDQEAPSFGKDVIEELEEEIVLLKSKESGHRRVGPQSLPETVSSIKTNFKCDKCNSFLESQGLLTAHMRNQHTANQTVTCELCDKDFKALLELARHMSSQHTDGEWNCNECDYQVNTPTHLMDHLKTTGHQPSPTIKNRKSLFKDYKQCYTCKKEFEGYWNLMNHRHSSHPSNKKCRNFPNDCKWGRKCWYMHEEPEEPMIIGEQSEEEVEAEQNVPSFKCNICDQLFGEQRPFMEHKKNKHSSFVSFCDKFLAGQCQRREEECWYKHSEFPSLPQAVHQQVFRKVQENPFPPDQMAQIMNLVMNLCKKVENLEGKINNLKQ